MVVALGLNHGVEIGVLNYVKIDLWLRCMLIFLFFIFSLRFNIL